MNITNLLKKPFVRNVLVLSTGTASAQIIVMLLSPVITRMYGPEAFGLMGSFAALIALVSPIAALTFPVAIVLPKQESEAKGLIKLSLVITVIISLLVSLLLLIFHVDIVSLFQLEEISLYLYLIPIVLFFAGLLEVIQQWFIRTKQFGVIAKGTFLQAILINIGKVGVGLFYPFAFVLILFSAITQGIKAFLILLIARNSKPILNILKIKYPIKKLIIKYKDFPLYRAPQTFVNSISESLPILMLASFFGPASVGFYNIGRTVLNIPTQLIGKSVGDVFYPKISSIANNRLSITNLLIKSTFVLLGIAIFPLGVVVIFGPYLFSFVFGTDWIIAGEYARWIALWSFSSFILQPALRTLPVLLAQRFHLIYTFISLIIRMSMLTLGYYFFSSDIVAIALFTGSSGLLNILLIFITIYISKKFDEKSKEFQ